MRTRPGICNRKIRYPTLDTAQAAAHGADIRLRPYRCDLCKAYHLTSRTKGMRIPRPT